MASMNSPLLSAKPYCSKGRAESQEEDPFSVQHSTANCKNGGQLERMDLNRSDKDR